MSQPKRVTEFVRGYFPQITVILKATGRIGVERDESICGGDVGLTVDLPSQVACPSEPPQGNDARAVRARRESPVTVVKGDRIQRPLGCAHIAWPAVHQAKSAAFH